MLGAEPRRWRQAGGAQVEQWQTDCQADCCDAGAGSAESVAVGLSSQHTSAAPYETTDGPQEAAASGTPELLSLCP